jgi:hypothetical protein
MGDRSQKDKDKGQKQKAIKDAGIERQKREKQAKALPLSLFKK